MTMSKKNRWTEVLFKLTMDHVHTVGAVLHAQQLRNFYLMSRKSLQITASSYTDYSLFAMMLPRELIWPFRNHCKSSGLLYSLRSKRFRGVFSAPKLISEFQMRGKWGEGFPISRASKISSAENPTETLASSLFCSHPISRASKISSAENPTETLATQATFCKTSYTLIPYLGTRVLAL